MKGILIVTGGSRGIGAATARLAAQQGYAVCVNYAHNQMRLHTRPAQLSMWREADE